MKRIRFSNIVINKSSGLLEMEYRPNEIAVELGVSSRTVREWLKNGAPYRKDVHNRLWIVGSDLAKWVEENRKHKSQIKLADNEAFCLHCRKPVSFLDTQKVPAKKRLFYIRGKCPQCGNKIFRGGCYDQSDKS
jgi:hypothetical protein